MAWDFGFGRTEPCFDAFSSREPGSTSLETAIARRPGQGDDGQAPGIVILGATRRLDETEPPVEGEGRSIVGIDTDGQRAMARGGMFEEGAAEAAAMPAGVDEQAANEIVEKADEAGGLAVDLREPGLGRRQVYVAHLRLVGFKSCFAEKRMAGARGREPDGEKPGMVGRDGGANDGSGHDDRQSRIQI